MPKDSIKPEDPRYFHPPTNSHIVSAGHLRPGMVVWCLGRETYYIAAVEVGIKYVRIVRKTVNEAGFLSRPFTVPLQTKFVVLNNRKGG